MDTQGKEPMEEAEFKENVYSDPLVGTMAYSAYDPECDLEFTVYPEDDPFKHPDLLKFLRNEARKAFVNSKKRKGCF